MSNPLRMLLFIALSLMTPTEHERVAEVRARISSALEASVRAAGIAWPPADVYLRAFKREQQLEVWLGDGKGPLTLFETIPICATSGVIGPKWEEGDQQIPEGLYIVDKLNPESAGWLSLKLDYPNAADRARVARRSAAENRMILPGGDIAVHGSCVSVGCLAIDDDPIERVYLLALYPLRQGRLVHVHVFPGRFENDVGALLAVASDVDTIELWTSLMEAYFAFEGTHRVPATWPRADGAYGVAPR
jgi:murein L,D-transpeptidase YafK